ncbi:MAG TPA: hypothetical protein V6C78_17610, partial [Crinalium sp.]
LRFWRPRWARKNRNRWWCNLTVGEVYCQQFASRELLVEIRFLNARITAMLCFYSLKNEAVSRSPIRFEGTYPAGVYLQNSSFSKIKWDYYI